MEVFQQITCVTNITPDCRISPFTAAIAMESKVKEDKCVDRIDGLIIKAERL